MPQEKFRSPKACLPGGGVYFPGPYSGGGDCAPLLGPTAAAGGGSLGVGVLSLPLSSFKLLELGTGKIIFLKG